MLLLLLLNGFSWIIVRVDLVDGKKLGEITATLLLFCGEILVSEALENLFSCRIASGVSNNALTNKSLFACCSCTVDTFRKPGGGAGVLLFDWGEAVHEFKTGLTVVLVVDDQAAQSFCSRVAEIGDRILLTRIEEPDEATGTDAAGVGCSLVATDFWF